MNMRMKRTAMPIKRQSQGAEADIEKKEQKGRLKRIKRKETSQCPRTIKIKRKIEIEKEKIKRPKKIKVKISLNRKERKEGEKIKEEKIIIRRSG